MQSAITYVFTIIQFLNSPLFYHNYILLQIFSNGARKTTIFNILTRLAQPKTGKVQIFREQIDVRCIPSFSYLYENLTIEEHFIIFGSIKGMNEVRIDNFLKYCCKIMDIDKIIHKKVKFLSGGEKRKVQIGIALIGGSQQLMVDEPTSGLDPLSRKEFSKLYQNIAKKINVQLLQLPILCQMHNKYVIYQVSGQTVNQNLMAVQINQDNIMIIEHK